MVAAAMSPSFRRTHLPSLRSMAGNRITSRSRTCGRRSHQFAHFIGDQWAMVFDSQVGRLAAGLAGRAAAGKGSCLREEDAVDIWIARWLRVRRKDILAREGWAPRRGAVAGARQRSVGVRAKRRP